MKRHRAPLLAAALAATLVLGACGSEPSGSPADSLPAPGGDGLIPPRPVEIVSTADATMSSSRAGSAELAATSDMSIAPWGPIEYVVGPDLPALPTDDIGYVYETGKPVTKDQVAELAAAFGVQGEPASIDDGYSTYWRVGPDDGSAPSLWVYDDALQSWNYSAAYDSTGDVAVSCMVDTPAVATASPGEGQEPADTPTTSVEQCSEPAPPEGVPTAGEAEADARALLDALGQDPANLEFEVYADEWFASVTATEATTGNAPGKTWSFGYGAAGTLQHAGGQLATPSAVGPYPLVDLDTALARLAEQQSAFGYGRGIALDTGIGVAEPAVGEAGAGEAGVSEPAVVDPAEPAAEPLPVDVPEGDVAVPPVETIEPMPIPEPLPDPEPVVVTLVDVQADLWWVWDADGAVWLLPAYRFVDTDGGWHTVPAVTDEYMIQVEPDTVEPMPVDPPVDLPTTVAPDPGEVPVPDDPAMFDATVLEPYVGLTFPEFEAQAKELGASVRVVERDGEPLPMTMDLQFNRVNVAVVTAADTGVETVTAIHSVG